MDFREASLNILQLALSNSSQEEMTSERLIEEAIDHLPGIHREVMQIIEDKNCDPPDDQVCRRRCQRRTERSIQMLKAVMSSQTSIDAFRNLTISGRIEKVMGSFRTINSNLELKLKSENADFFSSFFEGSED